jgi:hypothetical protein
MRETKRLKIAFGIIMSISIIALVLFTESFNVLIGLASSIFVMWIGLFLYPFIKNWGEDTELSQNTRETSK